MQANSADPWSALNHLKNNWISLHDQTAMFWTHFSAKNLWEYCNTALQLDRTDSYNEHNCVTVMVQMRSHFGSENSGMHPRTHTNQACQWDDQLKWYHFCVCCQWWVRNPFPRGGWHHQVEEFGRFRPENDYNRKSKWAWSIFTHENKLVTHPSMHKLNSMYC